MRPLGDNLGNVLGIDLFLQHACFLDAGELRLQLVDPFLQFRNGSVAQLCHFFVVILALSPFQCNLCLF